MLSEAGSRALARPTTHLASSKRAVTPHVSEARESMQQLLPQQRARRNDFRLSKHADYQRVYRVSRKQMAASMSYFFAVRAPGEISGPRVGLTVGRVLGNAVERNRIKRRLRAAVKEHLRLLDGDVDVVLHPRRTVLSMEAARLRHEIARTFAGIHRAAFESAKRELQP